MYGYGDTQTWASRFPYPDLVFTKETESDKYLRELSECKRISMATIQKRLSAAKKRIITTEVCDD